MSAQPATPAKLLVLCTILLVTGCAGSVDVEHYAKSFSVDGRADVRVRAADAQVHVMTSDDPEVDFNVQYEKEDGSTPGLQVSSRQDGNVEELTANEDPQAWWSWDRFSRYRAIIDVRMPRNADLHLETSNGAIEVSSLNGTIWLHTSNGQIRAQQLSGAVDIGSSNGAIILEALKGKLKVRTSNGSISANGMDGSCEVATSNGRVQVAGRFEYLDISSSNGGVVARAESGSTISAGWRIRTSNAGIELSVPTDLKANLDVSTSNGAIRLDLPVTVQGYESKTQLNGTLNGGGPDVSIHTSNGAIDVRGI